jgi:hypothetical protein
MANELSRRDALAGLAAIVPAATTTAAASPADPALAAVAQHKAFWEEASRLTVALDAAESKACAIAGVVELRDQMQASWRAEETDREPLSQTRPRTPGGAAAMIEHLLVVAKEGSWLDEWHRTLLATVAESLRVMQHEAAAIPPSTGDDSFVAAIARLQEVSAACDALVSTALKEGDYDDIRELRESAWTAFGAAMATAPTTIEGYAARLEFFAMVHPCHDEGMVCEVASDCDAGGHDGEDYAKMIREALVFTAALLRKMGNA